MSCALECATYLLRIRLSRVVLSTQLRLWWTLLDSAGMIDAEIRSRFPGAEGYFSTASLGLPCEGTIAAMNDPDEVPMMTSASPGSQPVAICNANRVPK